MEEYRWFQETFDRVAENVGLLIRGKDEAIYLALVAIFAEGHLLINDVPGVGKTSLAKAIAASIDGSMNRIQFTPDLLPTDVTGVHIYHQNTGKFEFRPGPVKANIVVADEINRASPKTQSALLEVMEERQVTVDGERMKMENPFSVIATQNPVELDGTYHLPEAQIDRFMMQIFMGYPSRDAEVEVTIERSTGMSVDALHPVTNVAEVRKMIEIARTVRTDRALHEYAVDLIGLTRGHHALRLGVSPRGSLSLIQAAKALAASDGRGHAEADDIKQLARHVIGHRLLLTAEAEISGVTTHSLMEEFLNQLPTPTPVGV